MRVLVACERSGTVRNEFLIKGHDAWSCDLYPSRGGDFHHYRQDVEPLLRQEWDMVIAHPPCTYLCNSGVRWLAGNEKRWADMVAATEFFRKCLDANASMVCVENPIMHGEAARRVGQRYTQIIHPSEFGSPEKKSTCLWLKGLPPLVPTCVVRPTADSIHRMPPGRGRAYQRSITFLGIAQAMAEQWGGIDAAAFHADVQAAR